MGSVLNALNVSGLPLGRGSVYSAWDVVLIAEQDYPLTCRTGNWSPCFSKPSRVHLEFSSLRILVPSVGERRDLLSVNVCVESPCFISA